jgi:hypothetical protein
MDNKLLNLLPIKSANQTNSNSNYDRFNNYCFQICEIIDKNYVKLDIGEEKYIKILGYLHSKKWQKIIQNNCKHFFYNDLQLIINEYGDQWCKKDKIFSYNTLQNNDDRGNDIRVSLYRTNKIPIDLFPPITTYHDIRKIVKTRFIKDNVSFEVLVIGHRDKCLSYEIKIYGNTQSSNILQQFVNFYEEFCKSTSKDLNLFRSITLNNYDISKLSVSII